MTIRRIAPDEEQRLIDSVQTAIGLANDGTDPSEAVAKVASDQGYGPDFAERMVNMFNTSRTLAHLKNTDGSDRAADFPIADFNKVASAMVGSEITPGVDETTGEILSKSANFMKVDDGEPLEKIAHVQAPTYPRYAEPIFERALNARTTLQRKVAAAKTDKSAAEDRQREAFRKLALYFRTPGHRPFAEIEQEALGSFSKAGALVMDVAWDFLGNVQSREKRAGEESSGLHLLDPESNEYGLIKAAVDASVELADASVALKQVKSEYDQFSSLLSEKLAEAQQANKPQGVPHYIQSDEEDEAQTVEDQDEEEEQEDDDEDDTDIEVQSSDPKQAGYDQPGKRDGTGPFQDSYQRKSKGKGKRQEAGEACPFMVSIEGGDEEEDEEDEGEEKDAVFSPLKFAVLSKALDKVPFLSDSSDDAEVTKTMERVNLGANPEQEAELRAIESEALLQDMIATDPVVSTYDPDEILMAYNDIAKFAPQSVTQPMLLRSYLRKYLESSSDPAGKIMEGFEAKQLGDIEKNLQGPAQEADKRVVDVLKTYKPKPEAQAGGAQ